MSSTYNVSNLALLADLTYDYINNDYELEIEKTFDTNGKKTFLTNTTTTSNTK